MTTSLLSLPASPFNNESYSCNGVLCNIRMAELRYQKQLEYHKTVHIDRQTLSVTKGSAQEQLIKM
jgi:hypothetical protein